MEAIFAVDSQLRGAASAAVRRGTLRRIVQAVYTRDLGRRSMCSSGRGCWRLLQRSGPAL
jgi:hypothetical protein